MINRLFSRLVIALLWGVVALVFPSRLLADDVILGPAPDIPPTAEGKAENIPHAPTLPGVTVNPHSRQVAAAFYRQEYLPSVELPIGWSGNRNSCSAGTTSAAFREGVARRINYFRAMAGVPANITLVDEWNQKAQQAALMMHSNQQLSHAPTETWLCYTVDGSEAAGKSNLALGVTGAEAITLYMKDPGTFNNTVGHRRWLLYPQSLTMGTGDIPQQGDTWPWLWAANALWVIDGNFGAPRPTTREPFVAWPPPGYVPYPVVFGRWSLSYDGADFSETTVTMTRAGMPLPVTIEAVTGGRENTLVWIPAGMSDGSTWPQPAADTPYTVELQTVLINGTAETILYTVTIFDPEGISYSPGDGNGDGAVNAGDLAACTLELFDGDGTNAADAPGGGYPGTVGCDSNLDGTIDAGDLTCTVLLIFNGPNACLAEMVMNTPVSPTRSH